MGTIYEDVEALQEEVAVLKTTVAELTVDDSGWLNLPLAEGILAYNEALIPKYRKIGNEVFLSGVIKNITAANTILATLPEGYRPTRQQYFVAGSKTLTTGASYYNCQVNADGDIRITAHSSAAYSADYYLRLGGSFLVD